MNYGRCLATMALHFNCNPVELDQEQVLDYLQYLKTRSNTPSSSYFKHTVYGLSFAYKALGMEGYHISLPSIKFSKKLPVVLSKNEVKKLLRTPALLKHRIVLALLYGCGLRRFELLNIKLADVDLDRKMLHIREGKGRKDRYVPIGDLLARGLKTYLDAEHPYIWLINGKDSKGQLQRFSETGVQWIIREATRKAGIKKHVTSHVLRHTYATHLLEMGLDIMTLKDLLGHVDIHTTMIYLHVAQLGRDKAFNPLDKIYRNSSSKES
jgi:integrase/recombinase XerD